MTQPWKPMLAAKPDPEDIDNILPTLRFPLLGSPKLDGIRATVQNGKLYSRSLKLIPNKQMQTAWAKQDLNGLDGEIVVGPPTAEDCFNRSTSVVMSRDRSMEGARFYVFDSLDDVEPFSIRVSNASLTANQRGFLNLQGVIASSERWITPVEHTLLKNIQQLLKYEEKCLKQGYEGIMLRDPKGAYKQGRSTLKEGGLIAVKRFVDAEAVVLDTYEQEENTNEKTINELGRSKRSTHKAGKVGKDTLGGFVVQMGEVGTLKGKVVAFHKKGAPFNTQPAFNIGTGQGLTDALRKELWGKRKGLVGQIIKFRYQKIGTMVAPRQPIFLGFRDPKDL